MSKFGKIAVIVAVKVMVIVIVMVMVMVIVMVLALFQAHSDPEADSGQPVDAIVDATVDAIVAIECVYTPSEATVEVSAYFCDREAYGKGIIVRRYGQMFVLTSSMIFTKGTDKGIVVTEGSHTYDGTIIHQNDIFGLVALECSLRVDTPFIELNDDPTIPPFVQVGINGWLASTLEHIDDWVLLGDIPEEDCTGCPVTQNGYVVGIVVGTNRTNCNQMIMAGNRVLKEFCDQVVFVDDAPLVLEVE